MIVRKLKRKKTIKLYAVGAIKELESQLERAETETKRSKLRSRIEEWREIQKAEEQLETTKLVGI